MKLIVVTVMVALAMAVSNSTSAAQEPPLPTNRYVSQFPVSAAPAQYELVQLMLDFAPGASTLLHSHRGPTYVTVLEGQVTRSEEGKDSSFAPGQTFIEEAGKFHSAANRGSARARVMASLLLSPGQPVTINHPDGPTPSATPTTTFISRTTLGVQPAEFTLTQVVVDFGVGAYLPLHTHGGPGIVTVSQGEIEFGRASGSERKQTNGVFLEVDEPHTARNVGSGPATAIVTFLIRKGAAITSFVTPPAPVSGALVTSAAPRPGPISPPSTGDAGRMRDNSPLAFDRVVVVGVFAALGLVFTGIAASRARRLIRLR
ncbi:MAG TPA: cupin domain-containing protein [Dehalococcoidia bacterium]|nr:cupin domain-containing protein [Dehalococcoidia bacterium]